MRKHPNEVVITDHPLEGRGGDIFVSHPARHQIIIFYSLLHSEFAIPEPRSLANVPIQSSATFVLNISSTQTTLEHVLELELHGVRDSISGASREDLKPVAFCGHASLRHGRPEATRFITENALEL